MFFNNETTVDISVNLRRVNAGVSQKHLYDAQIRAGFQKMGGEGMPKSVRRNMFFDTG